MHTYVADARLHLPPFPLGLLTRPPSLPFATWITLHSIHSLLDPRAQISQSPNFSLFCLSFFFFFFFLRQLEFSRYARYAIDTLDLPRLFILLIKAVATNCLNVALVSSQIFRHPFHSLPAQRSRSTIFFTLLLKILRYTCCDKSNSDSNNAETKLRVFSSRKIFDKVNP